MQYTAKEVYEFISKQTNDPIVERKTCAVSGQPFAIFQSDLDFYNKISPTFAGQRFQIPTPTLCPEERQRRRLMFRNERKLYRRKCDASGKNIISMYNDRIDIKVYDYDYRWSDMWNPLQYGIDIDRTTSLFAQFQQLQKKAPLVLRSAINNENSEYVNFAGHNKNCYLVFDTDFCEDSYYGSIMNHSNNVVDSMHIYKCEVIYNCINCTDSSFLFDSIECDNSHHLYSCMRCTNCTDCIGCSNLVGKQYYINNVQYSKNDYQSRLQKNNYYTISPNIEECIQRSVYTVGSEGVIGNNIYDSKDIVCSHNIGFSESLKYCDLITHGNHSYDVSSFGSNIDKVIDCGTVGINSYNIMYSHSIVNSSNMMYCMYCWDCKDCFGCVGLRKNQQYCIFNKQYTKEEYELTVAKIIAHMQENGERGEFFHPSLSPFGYNETVAQEYFPLTRTEAFARGYKRQDNNYDPVIPEGAKVIDWKITSEEPTENEQILKSIFVCEVSARPYRIIKQELEFYRKHHLPLPRKHPDIRHEERMKLRPGRTLYLRNCDQCGQENLSVYGKDYIGKVYCESCYQQEVYG